MNHIKLNAMGKQYIVRNSPEMVDLMFEVSQACDFKNKILCVNRKNSALANIIDAAQLEIAPAFHSKLISIVKHIAEDSVTHKVVEFATQMRQTTWLAKGAMSKVVDDISVTIPIQKYHINGMHISSPKGSRLDVALAHITACSLAGRWCQSGQSSWGNHVAGWLVELCRPDLPTERHLLISKVLSGYTPLVVDLAVLKPLPKKESYTVLDLRFLIKHIPDMSPSKAQVLWELLNESAPLPEKYTPKPYEGKN